MPSKAALEAFKKLEIEKIKGLPADQVQSALESAQRRVNAIAKKSTIFDEEAEKAVLRFSHEGKFHFVLVITFVTFITVIGIVTITY